MKTLIPFILALTAATQACAGERSVPPRPQTHAVRVAYNGEILRAWYLLIDARGPAERAEDARAGSLKGPVIVFFPGHAQRPPDSYSFTSRLALGCRSGIAIVPVSDTPYGEDESLRGDRGKEAVLMAVVKRALAYRDIEVQGGPSPDGGEAEVLYGGAAPGPEKHPVSTRLVAVGWSHGGILARRVAHSYPDAVTGLGQVCPAGYERRSPLALTGSFIMESMRISRLSARGHAGDALTSAWGFTRGFVGDIARSVADAAVHGRPAKVLRAGRDIRDCSLYCDAGGFGVGRIRRVAVVFGADDTCMSLERILGVDLAGGIPQEARSRFWETYYPEALSSGATLSLHALPGTHLAPVTHSGVYADRLLEDLGEQAGFPGVRGAGKS